MFDNELEALNFVLAWDHNSVYHLKQAIEFLRDCNKKEFTLVLPGAVRSLQQTGSEPEAAELLRQARIIAVDRFGRILSGHLHKLQVQDIRYDDISSSARALR